MDNTIKPWGIDAAYDTKPTEPWFDDFGDTASTLAIPSGDLKEIIANAKAGQVIGPLSSNEMKDFARAVNSAVGESVVIAPQTGLKSKLGMDQTSLTEVTPTAIESQVDGDHYNKQGIQPLEATFQNFGYEGLRASIYTKVGKYLTREKGTHRKDIAKAIHCLQMQLEFFDRSTK